MLVDVVAVKRTFFEPLPDSILEDRAPLADFLRAQLGAEPAARVFHFPGRGYVQAKQGFVFQHWKAPSFAGYGALCSRLGMPYLNLMDGIPVAQAHESLALAGIAELRSRIEQELAGTTALPPGQRWMDRFGVRWAVTLGSPDETRLQERLEPVWRDGSGQVTVFRNAHAAPLYQWRASDDPAAAASAATTQDHVAARLSKLSWIPSESAGTASLTAPTDGTAFAAIPYYPGWTAWVDGKPQPPRPAPGGGMTVPLSKGDHQLELRFVPLAFHLGACIEAVSLIVLAVLLRWTR
jgi:hypothetical protein